MLPANHTTAAVQTDPDRSEKWLWGAILFGIFLRLNQFWKQSLWLDELSTAWVAAAEGWSTLWQRCLLAHQPPVYYYVVKPFLLLGHTEFWIRLPSMIFGLASLAILIIFMRQVTGRRGAIYGGAIFALNSRAIYHSQEARMYAMVLFFALVSTWFFIAWVNHGGRWRLAAYAAATLLVAYSHIIYSSLLFAQTGVAILLLCFDKGRFGRLRCLLGAQLLLLLLLLPLGSLFLSIAGHSRAGMGDFIKLPDPHYFIWFFGYQEFGPSALLVLSAPPVLLALFSLPALWTCGRRFRDLSSAEQGLLGLGCAYFLIFPAAVVLALARVANILEPRYLLLPVLGAIMLVGLVVSKTRDPGIRIAACAYLCVLVAFHVIFTIHIGAWVNSPNQDWRGAIPWIEERYRTGDVVLLHSGLIEAKYLSLDDPGASEYLSLPFCGFYDRGGMRIFNLPWRADQLYSSGLTPAAVQNEIRKARQVFFLMAPLLSDNWDWTFQEKWLQGFGPPPQLLEEQVFGKLGVRLYRLSEESSAAR